MEPTNKGQKPTDKGQEPKAKSEEPTPNQEAKEATEKEAQEKADQEAKEAAEKEAREKAEILNKDDRKKINLIMKGHIKNPVVSDYKDLLFACKKIDFSVYQEMLTNGDSVTSRKWLASWFQTKIQ